MYLDGNASSSEPILMEITETIIGVLHGIDDLLWKQFILTYFEWIDGKNFNFDYCDVIVGHIYKAYQITEDLEIRSKAVLSGAKLGRSHNRWYVMEYIITMCSPKISDKLADRLNIEIYIGGKETIRDLERCVEGLTTTITRYHQKIREALEH